MKPRIFTFFFFLLSFALQSQTTENMDLPSLKSPYSAILTHLHFLQTETYDPAQAALAIGGKRSPEEAQQLAIQLKQVLDGKGLFVQLNTLPKNNEYIDSTTHEAYYTLFPNELPEVYLEKVDSSWYYSQETMQLLPKLHRQLYPFGADLLVNLLPKVGQKTFLGLALWQYFGIFLLLLLTFLVHKLLSRIINPLIRFLSSRYLDKAGLDDGQVWSAARLMSILLLISMIRMFIPALLLPINISELAIRGIKIFSTVIVVLLVIRLLSIFMVYATRWAYSTEGKYDEQILPIVKRGIEIFVVLAGIIQILQLLQINITALIAGISIGGLALALAAQDTVKNLIGSAMIFIDRPFQIGDYIEWGGQAGTVSEVGFRTTRIRTSDTSIISVPNGTIANMAVTNKGVRVYRLFSLVLGVTYQTSPDQIERFVDALRDLVLKHPHTHKEDYYIYFNQLADSSLQIMFRVLLRVPGYADELKVKQELLLGILRLAEVMKINFAFPSTSFYLEQLPGDGSVPSSFDQKDLEKFLEEFQQKNSSKPPTNPA